MAEDKPLPVELPAPALKQAQRRVLWVQAASDRFGALVITHQANPGMTHFHPTEPIRAASGANTSPPSTRARARARGAGNQRPWPADKVERWRIDRLIPYAKNARTHTDAQIAAIAASIKEWGWTTPALVGEDGGLIAGHARILAARQLGIGFSGRPVDHP